MSVVCCVLNKNKLKVKLLMLMHTFSDVINRLRRYYRNRDYFIIDAPFEARLLAFINAIRHEQNPNAPAFHKPQNWDNKKLLTCATHIMVYRDCLGDAQQAKDKDETQEVEFYLSNPKFIEALNRNNLFALEEQLIHLANLTQRYNDMCKGNIAFDEGFAHKFPDMVEKITKLNTLIGNQEQSAFKDYLQFLACFVLTQVTMLKKDFNTADLNVAHSYLLAARVQARVGKTMQASQSQDEPICDFYTFGKGLFARTRFKSFEDAENILMNMVPIPARAINVYFNLANEVVSELKKGSSTTMDLCITAKPF